MRKVRMLQSVTGSPDGIQVILYQAGQVYELPERLAGPWLERGWAEEDKMVQAAPETKLEGPGPAKPAGRRRK